MIDRRRELAELRNTMGEVDREIVALLDRRAAAAKKIGELGRESVASLPATEGDQLRDILALSHGDMPRESLEVVFRAIYASCREFELPVVIAVAGIEGGPAHDAARERFGVNGRYAMVDTAALAVDEVERQRASFALVPYETHTDGPVQATISALAEAEVKVVGCVDATSNVQLATRERELSAVRRVFLTPLDRVRCRQFLSASLPKAELVEVRTPADACRLALEGEGSAALAPDSVALAHGLAALVRNVLDEAVDRVRYAIVGRRPAARTGHDRTAVVFSTSDEPGALQGVLRQFADRGVNMTKIHSRSVGGEAWQSIFFVEVDGHSTDRAVVAALEDVRRTTKFFKLLGAYPVQ